MLGHDIDCIVDSYLRGIKVLRRGPKALRRFCIMHTRHHCLTVLHRAKAIRYEKVYCSSRSPIRYEKVLQII